MQIFGIGKFAEVADYYFPHVTDFTHDAGPGSFCGKPVIPWSINKVTDEIYVAIGYSKLNEARADVLARVKGFGFKPISFVSTAAICLSRDFGEHVFILEGNVIQPFVRIGNNCILWSGNHIGHHSVIGDNCFISSHVVISGGCEVGNNTFIGVNSCIADGVKIGHHAIITMGSRVTKDVPDYGVWNVDKLSKIPSTRMKL